MLKKIIVGAFTALGVFAAIGLVADKLGLIEAK